jgi:hypothetical protein
MYILVKLVRVCTCTSATTGAWLTTLPNILNGSDLSADKFRDGVRLRLGMQPTSLPPRCDGCDERFTIEHAMSWLS